MTRQIGFWKNLSYLLIFLFPSQLAFHFWPSFSFIFGIRIDYLAPTVYFTDILLTILFIVHRETLIRWFLEYKTRIFFFLVFASANILLSVSFYTTFLKWLRLSEMILLAAVIYKEREILDKDHILKTLFISGVLFSFIGISQFIFGKASGTILYFLGERTFNVTTPGVALVQIYGRDFLRAYSTFPHPNSLAGYLGAILLFFVGNGFLKKNILYKLGLIVMFITLLLTFSSAAFVGFSVALVFLGVKKTKVSQMLMICTYYLVVITSLLMPIFSLKIMPYTRYLESSISERVDLTFISGKLISQKFWIGEGLNTFVLNIPKHKGALTYLWLLQPVHNIFLLVFSETGIFGILILFLLFLHLLKKNRLIGVIFLFVVITGFFDHYWFTLQQNLLLFSLIVGLGI